MFDFSHFIRNVLQQRREQRYREREVMTLARLDDRLLHDIGIDRAAVERLVAETFSPKPFSLPHYRGARPNTVPALDTLAGYRLQH